MFLDCYVYDKVDGFPESTYRIPDGTDLRALRKAAEKYFTRVVVVEHSNGQAPQELPSWPNVTGA